MEGLFTPVKTLAQIHQELSAIPQYTPFLVFVLANLLRRPIVVTSADGFGSFVKWKGIDVVVQAPSGVASYQLAVL